MKTIQYIIYLFLFALSIPAYSQVVDLFTVPIYVTDDFKSEWIANDPDFSNGWKLLEHDKDSSYNLKVISLFKKSDVNLFKYLFVKEKAHNYTYIFKFHLSDSDLNKQDFLGLYFSSIGANYEIFINGQKLASEVHLSSDGYILLRKYRRNFTIGVDRSQLKTDNSLLVRIIGEPNNKETGLGRSNNHVIDNYHNLIVKYFDVVSYILLFVYFLLGIYHFYLFIYYSKQKYYLFYSLFSFSVLIYFAARTSHFYSLFNNTEYAYLIESVSLFLILPLCSIFISSLLFNKIKKLIFVFLYVCLFLSIFTIFGNIRMKQTAILVWQYLSFIPIVYIIGFNLIKAFLNDFENYLNKENVEHKSANKIKIFGKTLLHSVSGNILFGSTLATFTIVYDIANSLFYHGKFFASKYGFFVFILSIAFIFSRRFYLMSKKYEILNTELIENVMDLKKANDEIKLSNQRYQHLVEETEDIIFSLDKHLTITKINTMVYLHLKYDPQDVLGTNFRDLLYHEVKHSEIVKEVVKENFDKLLLSNKSGTSVHFKTLLKSRYKTEPVEMRVYLVLLKINDEIEIIGKASPSIDDALVKYLSYEKLFFEIDNHIMLAEDMTFRLTRNLVKYIPSAGVNLVRVALREIIMNAIEHGNLGISFNDKSIALENGNYLEFLTQKQNDMVYSGKKVKISYILTDKLVEYIIEDNGNGFDYRKVLESMKEKNVNNFMMHGRGITIACSIFDKILYNDKGNRVSLIKYYNNSIS